MPGAYYNEIDPYAADWLRNLIAAGHIAPGDVDERSIEDVHPDDLRSYTQCHFFAGIGVWSYALRRAGWPDDRSVWTGSCPCQPFSAAGKGTAFDDERHLWPAWHWLISQCRPPIVFGEQVASKDAEPWLDLVSSDLEALAFAVAACAFPSASIGAPHIRDRTYFVAHAAGPGSQGRQLGGQRLDAQLPAVERGGRTGQLADAHIIAGGQRGAIDGRRHPGGDARTRAGSGGDGLPVVLADAGGERVRTEEPGAAGKSAARSGRSAGKQRLRADAWAGGAIAGGVADTDGGHAGAEREQRGGEQRQQPADGGAGGLANAIGKRRQDHAGPVGRIHQGPNIAECGGVPAGERPGPVNGFWGTADWLLCLDGKWRPVEPGTFPLAHGAPARVGRLRAYGNAINAQQAQIFIEESMKCL